MSFLELDRLYHPDFTNFKQKPLWDIELNTQCPAVKNPWRGYRLGDPNCFISFKKLNYVNASFDVMKGMWGSGVAANVDRETPDTIDIDSTGSVLTFHVITHIRVGGNFQTLCQIGFGGSDLLLRTGAAGSVRIQLLNVLGGSKTYDGALSTSTGDKLSFTGYTSSTEDFFCVVRNHTTGQSVEITSSNIPTGYFADAEEMNIQVQSNISYVELAYTGLSLVSKNALRALSKKPYDLLKPKQNLYYFPSAATGYTLPVDSGSYIYTGTSVNTKADRNVTADSGSYILTGSNITLSKGYNLLSDNGNYSLTGVDVQLTATRSIIPESGSYSLTGTDVNLIYNPITGYTLSVDSGSYSLVGTNTGLLTLRNLIADNGAYNLTGTPQSVRVDRRILSDSGSYSLSGTANGLILNRALVAASGSFTLTGTEQSLITARRVLSETGSYDLTGTNINLVYTPTSGAIINIDSGVFSVVGQSLGVIVSRKLPIDVGSYSITGTDVILRKGYSLNADNGSYNITGTDALFNVSRGINLGTGTYNLSGTSITLVYSNVPIIPTPLTRTLSIPFESRSLNISFQGRRLNINQ